MQRLGAIEAQPDVKTVLLEEPAPGLVDQQAVGLELVLDLLFAGVLLLQCDGLAVEVEPG
ncbi:MAG: hypothetical protein ACOY3P_06255 [Planctomycetota bacterium]